MWSWLTAITIHGGTARSRFSYFFDKKHEFNLSDMQELHQQLRQYSQLQEEDIVELLRVLSEFVIYSDQNRSDIQDQSVDFIQNSQSAGIFFDYFCEKNILALLVELGASRPSISIQVQLLQTLSLLVQNIATRTSLFYILSNNYVNQLILCPFAVTKDDDVRDWYVTFLKALSLRLNEETVQFFFNTQDDTFPLYSKAITFRKCSETMIKVAVKTLTLNVIRVKDIRVQQYIMEREHITYFNDIVNHADVLAMQIQEQVLQYHTYMKTLEMKKHKEKMERIQKRRIVEQIEEAIDEYMDHCFYIQDILDVDLPELRDTIVNAFCTNHISRFLCSSVLPNCVLLNRRVSTRLALYLLTRVLGIFEYKPLVQKIGNILLGKTMCSSVTFHPHVKNDCTSPTCYLRNRLEFGEWPKDEVLAFQPDGMKSSNIVRQSILSLMSSQDEMLVSGAILLLSAALNQPAINETDILNDFRWSYSSENSGPSNEIIQWILTILLALLSRTSEFRLFTTKLAIRLFKDIYSKSNLSSSAESSILNKNDIQTLREIHSVSTHHVMESMRGTMSDINLFINVIEEELKQYQKKDNLKLQLTNALPFECLIQEIAPQNSQNLQKYSKSQVYIDTGNLNPAGHATFELRDPLNEIEACRKSMKVFLLLRQLREFLDDAYKSDDLLQIITYGVPATITLQEAHRTDESISLDNTNVTTDKQNRNQNAPQTVFDLPLIKCTWRRQQYMDKTSELYLVLNKESFILVENLNSSSNSSESVNNSVYVKVIEPIHRTQYTMDARENLVLHFAIVSASPIPHFQNLQLDNRSNQQAAGSILKTWQAALTFTCKDDVEKVMSHIDIHSAESRARKLLMIEQAFSAHVTTTHAHVTRVDSKGELESDIEVDS